MPAASLYRQNPARLDDDLRFAPGLHFAFIPASLASLPRTIALAKMSGGSLADDFDMTSAVPRRRGGYFESNRQVLQKS